MAKLTKAQRGKMIPAQIRETIVAMSDPVLLAVHDLCHQEMERRHGTNKREQAGCQALQGEQHDDCN